MSTVIKVENLSKYYRLGSIGGDSFREDVNYWLYSLKSRLFCNHGTSHPDQEDRSQAEIWALRDVSFEVQQGEILGIIGRNGAGKSTLLKLLSRVTAPTSGRVEITGRVGSLLEVGTGFHPELTGRENIFLNGAILGMKKAEIVAKFDEIVEFAQMGRFIDTPVKRYSSGMTVRLAFAVAAHLEPEVLIVDEVLAVGDVDFQKKCVGKMRDVSRAGRTVLFVSHNLGVIGNMCHTGLVLDKGCVVTGKSSIEAAIAAYLKRSSVEATGEAPFVARWEGNWTDFTVNGISIGGERAGAVDLDASDGEIQLQFDIHSGHSFSCELEVRLYDSNGGMLGFYSPWRFGGAAASVKGSQVLEWLVKFPALAKGRYEAEIMLTVPNKDVVGRIAGRVLFETEGKIRGRPIYFAYRDVGHLLLEGGLIES